MDLNVVIKVPNRIMVLAYVTIQGNLEDCSMNVTAGTRMVTEFQAAPTSSNAVIWISPCHSLEALLVSVARIEERSQDGKNNVATIDIVTEHSLIVRVVSLVNL